MDTEVFGSMGCLAVGCQDGTVQVITKQAGVTRCWSISLDGPISCLKLYKTDKDLDRTSHVLSKHPIIRKIQQKIATTYKYTLDAAGMDRERTIHLMYI
jgi:hypothetical protein